MGVLKLLEHQHSANKVEDESGKSCSDNEHDKVKLPRYMDFVDSEIDSANKDYES